MVKLATARESRLYGPRLSRNRAEYMNAGLYVFSTIVLLCGFAAQLSREPTSGLVLLLIGLGLIILVNIHDLFAHLAGIDCRMAVMELDPQLLFVEVAVPVVHALGGVLFFLAILFLLIQEVHGYGHYRIEAHALNMLIAGTALWVLGSILNSCQIYERSDGHVQILQQSVHVPFLMGSLLLLVGAILNSREQIGHTHHGLHLLTRTWVWMGISGSLLLVIGGFANVVKVFKMLQMHGLRLEKLRGGAQERLIQAREGQTPFLIIEEQQRRPKPRHVEVVIEEQRRISGHAEEGLPPVAGTIGPTPYKDVLVGQAKQS